VKAAQVGKDFSEVSEVGWGQTIPFGDGDAGLVDRGAGDPAASGDSAVGGEFGVVESAEREVGHGAVIWWTG